MYIILYTGKIEKYERLGMDTPKGMVIDTEGKERTDTVQVHNYELTVPRLLNAYVAYVAEPLLVFAFYPFAHSFVDYYIANTTLTTFYYLRILFDTIQILVDMVKGKCALCPMGGAGDALGGYKVLRIYYITVYALLVAVVAAAAAICLLVSTIPGRCASSTVFICPV